MRWTVSGVGSGSRSYVKTSMARETDGMVLFPEPRKPTVANYSVKQTYGKLLDMVAEAFHKRSPLFVLGIYNPYAYYIGDDPEIIPALERGRRKQVVALSLPTSGPIRHRSIRRLRADTPTCSMLLT